MWHYVSSKLFALDIGTRSVIGIILEERGDQFHVVDMIMREHKERAMVDGQIHNVLFVAELIKEIAKELEEKHGPLPPVSVAAAGRALKTEQASITVDIRNRPIFTEEDINRLELQAVQQAQEQLLKRNNEQKSSHYYCVGYSVLYYKLDGEEIGSLLDQQGDEATVEVIATFLPRVVVESLMAALKRAGLEMEAMTLEPIAAINVLIPSTMRRLNVALVDVGAGTSDIAITNNGTIVAYGMVPTAGDEITEALSDHYLLDFPEAEIVKRKLKSESTILIRDILGFDQEYDKEEVLNAIYPSITNLAEAISNEILKLNNQVSPKAVMLVGGGSLTPHLAEEISKLLELPTNRVAVRSISAIQNLTKEENIPDSPDLVTPVGIGIAGKKSPIQYMTVKVNNQIVRLFEMKEMTVLDAFLAANIQPKQLYGKPGQGITVTVNERDIMIPGEHGQPATILVNGQEATTKTPIKNGDVIELQEGKDGQDANVKIRDIVDNALIKTVTFQDTMYMLEPTVTVNGEKITLDTPLKDRDIVTIQPIETVQDFLHYTKQIDLLTKLQSYYVKVNGKPTYIPEFGAKLFINGKPSKLQYPIHNGDVITIEDVKTPTVQEVCDFLQIQLEEKIVVTFQNELLEMTRICNEVRIDGVEASPTSLIENGKDISIIEKETSQWIFQDVFRFSNWQIPENFKGNFTILRNGVPATFDTKIFGGDKLEIILSELTINQS